jgi:uncharacterized repeat protein (TIGR03803 family)
MTLVLAVGSVHAQTLTTLYSFCGVTNLEDICLDGNDPEHLVKGTDGNFYGTTSSGGSNDDGTVFVITSQGTLTTLHQFTALLDGSSPHLDLQSGSLFYGTTLVGGTNHAGSIFTITAAGTFTTIHEFTGTNGDGFGVEPLMAGSGGIFVGTTVLGGSNDAGTVFTVTPSGTITTIHQFSGANGIADGSFPILTFADGAEFIGSTISGGNFSTGTVFEITQGGAFSTIHQFTGTTNDSVGLITAKNGANYVGTTEFGGSNGVGTAFLMTPQGTITTFYQFSGSNGVMDGSSPGLTAERDNNGAYYGATQDGGTNGQGLVFTLSTSGVLTPVYEFCSLANCADGTSPNSFALAGGSDVLGTTDGGGENGGGTVFRLVLGGGINGGGGGGGGVCTFELGASSGTFTASGGNGTVSVTASNGCTWTATNDDSFITITSGKTGSGNGTVHFTVAANSSTNPVVSTMTIAGNTFTVNQAGAPAVGACTFTLTPTVVKMTDKGGKKSISVKAVGTDCAWTAVSNDSFITITAGTNGTGNGKVSFTVAGNTNTTAQIGTLTIAGESVTVTQAPGGCTFRLSPKNEKLLAKGGAKTVRVTPNLSDCAWTAVSNSGFITITSGSTNILGKGTVSFNVGTNETSNILTGSMTIAGQTYTVIQAGAKVAP